MQIFAIDDEPEMQRLLHRAIAEVLPDARISDFFLASDALDAVAAGEKPDLIFSDIEMPSPNGLEFTERLKTLIPNIPVIFVTQHKEYALDAYRLHARGYVLKPVEAERIREEIQQIFPEIIENADKIQVRCFGYFEVFWQDKPIFFGRSRTKELLAFLVDHVGGTVTAEEVIAALYEETSAEKMKMAKQNLRNLVNDLKTTLGKIGMGKALVRQGSSIAINPECLDCDYYRMLRGDSCTAKLFRGQYMEQYSWAETTKGMLEFRKM